MMQVITLTGARPHAFALCAKWMRRQTYGGPVRWIIVDDGPTPTKMPARIRGWEIEVIRPPVLWSPGINTQRANMLAALAVVDDQHPLAIVEDDDWYAPDWLEVVADELRTCAMVGQRRCAKYNLTTCRVVDVDHPYRASLCCTALRGSEIGRLRAAAASGSKLMDCVLWTYGRGRLIPGRRVIGMKGLPGRLGIDSGHSPWFGDKEDQGFSTLREWVGDDAKHYVRLRRHTTMQRRQNEIAAYEAAYRDPCYRMGSRRKQDVVRILSSLPRGTLLDVGTGRGETLEHARKLGFTATGTEVVRDLVHPPHVVYAEAHALPFEDGAFDWVTCFDVLEHLLPEDVDQALREMARVAKRGVVASASELPSIYRGRELHISKRPAAEWESAMRAAWGENTRRIGSAGASPCWMMDRGRAPG